MVMIPNTMLYVEGKPGNWVDLNAKLKGKGLSNEGLIALFGGRFMPYHKGHFQTHNYISRVHDRVHIGVVNPDPWDTKLEGERFTLDKNFLTYTERLEMIHSAIDSIGGRAKTTISPYYPAHVYGEEKFWRFTPGNKDITISHMAVRDDFDRKKKERKIKQKRTFVEVETAYCSLINDYYGATKIRQFMMAGDEKWRQMVPDFTADVIDRYNIVERLRDLTADAQRSRK